MLYRGSILYLRAISQTSLTEDAVTASFPGHERSRHMGELRRGDDRWEVYLEVDADATAGTVRGRLHFATGQRHHETGWIFLEREEADIRERFGEFSAIELWRFLESLEESR